MGKWIVFLMLLEASLLSVLLMSVLLILPAEAFIIVFGVLGFLMIINIVLLFFCFKEHKILIITILGIIIGVVMIVYFLYTTGNISAAQQVYIFVLMFIFVIVLWIDDVRYLIKSCNSDISSGELGENIENQDLNRSHDNIEEILQDDAILYDGKLPDNWLKQFGMKVGKDGNAIDINPNISSDLVQDVEDQDLNISSGDLVQNIEDLIEGLDDTIPFFPLDEDLK